MTSGLPRKADIFSVHRHSQTCHLRTCAGVSSLMPEPFDRGIGSELAALPGAPYSSPKRLVYGFTREPETLPQWLREHLPCPLSTRRSERKRPKDPRLLAPSCCMRAFDQGL